MSHRMFSASLWLFLAACNSPEKTSAEPAVVAAASKDRPEVASPPTKAGPSKITILGMWKCGLELAEPQSADLRKRLKDGRGIDLSLQQADQSAPEWFASANLDGRNFVIEPRPSLVTISGSELHPRLSWQWQELGLTAEIDWHSSERDDGEIALAVAIDESLAPANRWPVSSFNMAGTCHRNREREAHFNESSNRRPR